MSSESKLNSRITGTPPKVSGLRQTKEATRSSHNNAKRRSIARQNQSTSKQPKKNGSFKLNPISESLRTPAPPPTKPSIVSTPATSNAQASIVPTPKASANTSPAKSGQKITNAQAKQALKAQEALADLPETKTLKAGAKAMNWFDPAIDAINTTNELISISKDPYLDASQKRIAKAEAWGGLGADMAANGVGIAAGSAVAGGVTAGVTTLTTWAATLAGAETAAAAASVSGYPVVIGVAALGGAVAGFAATDYFKKEWNQPARELAGKWAPLDVRLMTADGLARSLAGAGVQYLAEKWAQPRKKLVASPATPPGYRNPSKLRPAPSPFVPNPLTAPQVSASSPSTKMLKDLGTRKPKPVTAKELQLLSDAFDGKLVGQKPPAKPKPTPTANTNISKPSSKPSTKLSPNGKVSKSLSNTPALPASAPAGAAMGTAPSINSGAAHNNLAPVANHPAMPLGFAPASTATSIKPGAYPNSLSTGASNLAMPLGGAPQALNAAASSTTSSLTQSLQTLFDGFSTQLTEAANTMMQTASQPLNVVVDVQNGNIVAAVNQANTQTARRH